MAPRHAMLSVLAALHAVLLGCVPSNVVAETDRAVRIEADAAEWRPGSTADVPGFWRSGRMTGPLATSLWKLDYLFAPDGEFTGAALFAGPPPRYEVLSGTWHVDEQGRLVLGEDVEPATLEAAERMLRISGPDGAVVLYREELF